MENNKMQANRTSHSLHTLVPTDYYDEVTGQLMVTPEFEENYAYEGKLGISYSPEATIFSVWTPVAVKVELVLFEDLYSETKEYIEMELIAPGVFEQEVKRNLDNVAYLYAITYPDGKVVETVDPYAIATTVNGERSVVVDLRDTNPENWQRMESFTAATDAIIYEAHIRDFTISASSGVANKGKFLGVIEKGTQSPTGKPTALDYLKELGITHLQLLPMYDYQTVDERDPDSGYNWGYDPQNYNVPEGSYATNPYEPKTRIKEMKRMIQGLHEEGIRVIMDVVYNHVFEPIGHPFENTAPGYYFRKNPDGTMSDGTGCGNDTASEHVMYRKYMIDSLKYWAREYKLDGFRFDLMGSHDVETMNAIREALDEIDPSIIIIGEGWDLMTNLPAEEKANSKNAEQMPRIAHFNDALRQAIKGSDMDGATDPGFVSGKAFQEQWIAINQQGGLYFPEDIASYQSPDQMVQYVEAHDNHTLYDKLTINMPDDDEETRKRRHLLATSMVLLAQGIPFIHAGQEFLRTKDGVENSYKSPDAINRLDWSLRDSQMDAVEYVKGLIALRKSEPLFRLRTAEEIALHMEVWKAEHYQVMWQVEDEIQLYYVYFNGNGHAVETKVELGDYEVLVHDGKTHLDEPIMWQHVSEFMVEGFSTTVIRKRK
ncbi:type I pullulanase [Jeotgalibaca caeni]|uniref:type I pullulanase n=1 Tax=Jeotgalibaca caeni TaxID=3028623 RepID=UPI00237DEC2E|nr:type I pullulanase [Jeotgalibaca caeni]MDE1548187.1 type I pullulanase [Jeotgalibaca caeni]